MCDYRRGFELGIGFIGHLYTWLEITSNYSAITNLHTLQITTAHAKFLPACCFFTRRSLVMASDSGYSSASASKSPLNGGSIPTDSFIHRLRYSIDLVAPVVFLITPRHGQRSNTVKSRIHCCGNVFTEPFPSSGRLFLLIKNTDVVLLSVSRPLSRK
jgi:hypothetical protein